MLDRRLKYIILLLLFLSGFVSCGDVEVGTKESSVSNTVLTEIQQTVVEKTVPATEQTTIIASTVVEQTTTPLNTTFTDPETSASVPELTSTVAEKTSSAIEQNTEAQIEPEKEVVRNPLTNEIITSLDELPVRPVVVSIGNNSGARPQSGLSYADIVYEVPAEGGVSRYLGVFYSQSCDKIGPCRSARPYIVRIAAQYKAALAHVGGSMEALELLDTNIVPDIDEFAYSSTFWRSKDRKAPNNCYTSTDKLLNWYSKHDYTIQRIPQGFTFLDEEEKAVGEDIEVITVDYISAKNSYKYNKDDGLYYRYISGSQQVDPEGNVKISCANVIIQYVNSQVLDDEGRLAIDLYKGGNAEFFLQGKMISGTWQREGDNAVTLFYDADGNEMKFATGKTWIQLVDKTCKVSYE